MKKAKFIINPSSGKQNFLKDIEAIIGCLILNQVVNHIDVAYTSHEKDARIEAWKMQKGEYDFAVAIGGDGTVNDVVNGILKRKSEIPLAIISAGTSNGFASSLNLPTAKEAVCKMLMDFKHVMMDAGRINNDYFINAIAGGAIADINDRVNQEHKAVFGKMAYYIEGAKDLPRYAFKSFKLRFESAEYSSPSEGEDVMLFVTANSHNVAGMNQFIPKATADDGWLDVAIFKKMDIASISSLVLKFTHGVHLKHPKVKYFKTKKLKIVSMDDKEMPIDYDGEVYGKLPLLLESVPQTLKIIVPCDPK